MAYENYSGNSFYCNGKKYFFTIELYGYNDTENNKLLIDLEDVESFEYVNGLNNLFLTGTLVYIDRNGTFDRFIEQNNVIVDVYYSQITESYDGSLTVKNLTNLKSSVNFRHRFLIDKLKIVGREKTIIKYSVSLVSANWLKCIKNIPFTNYNVESIGSSSTIPNTNIFNIISNILANAGLKINKTSFEYAKSNTTINYITSRNDNVITAINHLLRKLYYTEADNSNGMKFLAYNEYTDQFNIFNIADKNTILDMSTIVLSFFNTNTEKLLQTEPNQLNAVTKFPRTANLRMDFQKKISSYDLNSNSFSTTTFTTENFKEYQNEHLDVASSFIQNKYDILFNSDDYIDYGAYWNNDFNIYGNILKNMLENSSLVVNTDGELARKPADMVLVNLDKNSKYLNDENLENAKDLKKRYLAYSGAWFVGKVRHIIYPNTILRPVPSYSQNLVLFRNFVHDKSMYLNKTSAPTS